MMGKRKIYIFGVLLLLIVIIVLLVISFKMNRIRHTKNVNVAKDTAIVKDNEGWLYYAQCDGIYKCQEDKSSRQKIYAFDKNASSGGQKSLYLYDDWLYFKYDSKVYKINIKDYKVKYVCDSLDGTGIRIYDGYIYFGHESRVKLNGNGAEQIYDPNSASAYTVNVANGYLYFMDTGEDGENKFGIYEMDINSGSKKEIFDGRADYMTTDGEWIYFQNQKDGHSLYKMRMDGSEIQLLSSMNVQFIAEAGEWLYYYSGAILDGTVGIYQIKKDGSECKLLYEYNDGSPVLFVVDDWIYYASSSSSKGLAWNNQIQRMKIDGTTIEKFAQVN